jgi:hypothetical protein
MTPAKETPEGNVADKPIGAGRILENPAEPKAKLQAQEELRQKIGAKAAEVKAENAGKLAALKGQMDIAPEDAAVAETTDSWKTLGESGGMDQLGKNMDNFSERITKMIEKISDMLNKIFGGDAVAKGLAAKTVFGDALDDKPRSIDGKEVITKEKEKIKARQFERKARGEVVTADADKMTDYGAKIHTLWSPEDPKNVMNWFCSIKKVRDPKTGNVYLADSNGVQSYGRFQFNNGYLKQFVGYIRSSSPEYLDQLSPTTKSKVLSIADKGQHKGDYSNFLTNAEGVEFLEKVLKPHAELEYNFRGEGFFEKQLPYILKFQSEFPKHADFIKQMGTDQRYLAVILDISNQCGPGGARKVIKYVLSHLGENTHPSPAHALQLFLDGGNGSVNSGHENARKIRTIYCFVIGSGRETGFPFQFAKSLLRDFQSATGAQKEAVLKGGAEVAQKKV